MELCLLYRNCHSGYVELDLHYVGDLAISFLCSLSEYIIGGTLWCLSTQRYLHLFVCGYLSISISLYILIVKSLYFLSVVNEAFNSSIRYKGDMLIFKSIWILDFRQWIGKFWIVKHLSSICPKLFSSKVWTTRFSVARDDDMWLFYTMLSNSRGFTTVMTKVDTQRIKFQGNVSDLFY